MEEVKLIAGLVPLQIVVVLGVETTGAGLTVIFIGKVAPVQVPAEETGVTL